MKNPSKKMYNKIIQMKKNSILGIYVWNNMQNIEKKKKSLLYLKCYD